MRPLYRCCAGLDVHKKSVSACIRQRVEGSKEIQIEEAVYGTFTQDLERLRDWLKQHKVRQVAMESTGVYWIPVWNVLEPDRFGLELTLVNPHTVRALRGAKTDRIDAQRLAELLQFGLLKGSFVPPRATRELRDLTRLRVRVQQDRNRMINRIARLLETANIKLGSVVSNIIGKSGKAILSKIAGSTRIEPENLADLAVGSLRNKKDALVQALRGRYTEHFRWMLAELLSTQEWLDKRLIELDARIGERMEPYADVIRRLCTIPGVDRQTAWMLISEIGLDMSRFPSASHLASWAGLCPGNCESAGKRMSGRMRKGDRYVRRGLVQSGWAVAHKKNCFLTALLYRTARRRGMKKACIAVAHRILVIAYYVIRDGVTYRERGGDYWDRLRPEATADRLMRRLEKIGFQVVLTRRPEAAVAVPESAPPDEAASGISDAPRRGRPCKCAERGLVCSHKSPRPAGLEKHVGTASEANPTQLPEPNAQRRSSGCRVCDRWMLDVCIHARPRS